MKKVRFPVLPYVAFVSGFALMTFELAAARVLAPSVGSSTYVWTSVIGVIIAALSLGYWLGGRLADVRHRMSDVAFLCLGIALTVTLVMVAYPVVLTWATQQFVDARLQGVLASFVLFAPTSFLLGILAPYLVKLKITELASSGRSYASLSAMESIGGIVGTFVTGFVLFGYIGARETFAVVALLLVISSWLLVPAHKVWTRAVVSVVLASVCVGWLSVVQQGSIDTPSAHYTIVEGQYNGQLTRGIRTGPGGVQSGILVQRPNELAFWYTQQMADVVRAAPEKKTILVLGGGTFTLPRYLAETYPDSRIDVVEIDPELATIARQYFYYNDPSNVQLIFQDARTYINETKKQYDVVLVDVYSDASVPFSLATKEYGEQLARITTQKAIVAANMIVGGGPACTQLWQAFDAPYRAQFRHGSYRVGRPGDALSNIVAVYGRDAFSWQAQELPFTASTPFTDNYAPVERLHMACRSQVGATL